MNTSRDNQIEVTVRELLAAAMRADIPQQREITKRLAVIAPERWVQFRYNMPAFIVDESFRVEVETTLRGLVVGREDTVHHGVIANLAVTIGYTAQPLERRVDWRQWMSLPSERPAPTFKPDAVREAIELLETAVEKAWMRDDMTAAENYAALIGEMSQCVDLSMKAIAVCQRVLAKGAGTDTLSVKMRLAQALQHTGDTVTALEQYEGVIRGHSSAYPAWYLVWSHLEAGRILLARGDVDGADVHLDASLGVIRRSDIFRRRPPVLLARELASAGRRSGALAFCREVHALGLADAGALALLADLEHG